MSSEHLDTPKTDDMPRIQPNPCVRRRLFEADHITEMAKIDNFANTLQESINRDRIEKSLKWNFDFANDLPLPGPYEWHPFDGNTDWVGVKSEKECNATEDSCVPMKSANEVTPKSHDEEALPILRKRRRDPESVVDKGVRRKISF